MAKFEVVEQEGMRFVKIGLADETMRAQEGALSSMSGIVMDAPLPAVGRILKSYRSEQSYLGPTYTGTGDLLGVLCRLLRLRPRRRDLDPGKR
jgi:hypothetical protein